MALGATVYKCALQVSDLDRGYYADHHLVLALHPSETELRMMVRVLAFALYADERLEFGRGVSTDDEPDLWRRELNDDIGLWVDLGQPDEKRVRRACGRAREVVVLGYQTRAAAVWWAHAVHHLERFANLSVWRLGDGVGEQLLTLVRRSMRLQCLIQDGEVWLSDDARSVALRPERVK